MRHTTNTESIEDMKAALKKNEDASKQKHQPVILAIEASVLPLVEQDADDTSDSDSEAEDSDDETSDLIKELEKIKRERRELVDKAREEQEEKMQAELEGQAMAGNPLMRENAVKRKWDDDVVFKNQGAIANEPTGKRFINDLIRSDFHKKFMGKYLQ